MFIVKKTIKEKDYYYLRESKRENGKVIAKTIAYLGKNKKQAEEKAKQYKLGLEKKDMNVEIKSVKKPQKNVKRVVKELSIEDLSNFCKRKGFVFRSSDIYGGFAGFWDLGPLGVELFNNIKTEWWNYFVQQKDNMVGIEASIISHPTTWKASGHLEGFSDVAVICKKCKKSTKIDKSEVGKVKCDCGGDYDEKGEFNLMFKTSVGALDAGDAYLRGETAQAMFMDFKLVAESSRNQLPFGIAQIGRCFRNEIAPRDFIFRSREFHIGEFEFFIHPEEIKCNLLEKKHLELKLRLLDAESQENNVEVLKETTIGEMLKQKRFGEWHAYWLAEQIMWFYNLGLDKIKIREHKKDELSFYSSATFDIDYEYPFGSSEVAGNANRGQYDLNQHIKESGQKLEIYDENTKKSVIPRVIEPTFGMERIFLAAIVQAYTYNEKRDNVVLKLDSKIAPIKAAVFPLVRNDEKLVKLSKEVYESLKKEWNVVYDSSGSVGRRYSRNDEIGTPYCITIDSDSIKGKDVTIRDRDTTKQIRIKISDLKDVFRRLILGEIKFEKAGKLVVTRVK